MYHISVNLAMGRREKICGVQKAPGGGKKAISGRQKIVSKCRLFFPFFILKFCGGRHKISRGH